MDNCNWIEMTDSYYAGNDIYFLIGQQYKYKDTVQAFREYGCDEGCSRMMLHYVVCLDGIDYEIPSDVAVVVPTNNRPDDEVGGYKWRRKYREDKTDWMKNAEDIIGSFPKRKGKAVDLRKYNELTNFGKQRK